MTEEDILMMKKLLLALTLICCLLLAGCELPELDASALPTATPEATEAAVTPTPVPAAETEAPASETEAPADAETERPLAFLVVTVGNAIYEPIPLRESGRYTISRGDFVNIIEVTPESICMAESSCDNQDCVEQGTVSLDNKDERVLQNMIICLPNEVVLELYTYEEVEALLPGWLGVEAE